MPELIAEGVMSASRAVLPPVLPEERVEPGFAIFICVWVTILLLAVWYCPVY